MASDIQDADITLDRDTFFRDLLRGLTGSIEDIIGFEEASGFVSTVGKRVGDEIDRDYRRALGLDTLDRDRVAEVLVDLKRRIGGDFEVVEADEDRIVLINRACPFGDRVRGRPSLCMMTSNVFGTIAAENLGFAKVTLEETIAEGDGGCRVVVHLRPTEAAEAAPGRSYYRAV